MTAFDGGALANGSDDRAAILVADGLAVATGLPLRFTKGVYAIGSDMTLASPVEFAGGRIKLNGYVLTFASQVSAPACDHIFDISAGGRVVFQAPVIQRGRWYGAKDDGGATDAAPAFNAAIAAMLGSSVSAPIVEAPGTFRLKTPIVANAGLDLAAMVSGIVIAAEAPGPLRYKGSTDKPVSFTVDAAMDIEASAFDFRAASAVSMRDIGIRSFADNHALIEFGIRGCTGTVAGGVDGPGNIDLEGIHLYGGQHGVYADTVSVINVRDPNISYASVCGMLFLGSGDATIVNPWINNTNIAGTGGDALAVGAAIVFANGSRNITVSGGKIEQNYKGILVDNSQGVTVNGVQFDANKCFHGMIAGDKDTSGKTANLAFQPRGVKFVACRFLAGGSTYYVTDKGRCAIIVSNTGVDLEVTVALVGNSFSRGGTNATDLDTGNTNADFGTGPVDCAVLIHGSGTGTSMTTIVTSGNDYNDCSEADVRIKTSNVAVGKFAVVQGDVAYNVTDDLAA